MIVVDILKEDEGSLASGMQEDVMVCVMCCTLEEDK